MGTKISREDIVDADIVDAAELSSDGTEVFKNGPVVRITGSFLTASFLTIEQGFVDFDEPVSGGDLLTISGSGNADGVYFVQAVITESILQVSGSFSGSGTSTGSWFLAYTPGAKAVGYDPTTMAFSSSVTHDLFGFAKDTTYQRLLEEDPAGIGVNDSISYSANRVTNETWRRATDNSVIKTVDYTYSGAKVSQEIRKIYAEDGVRIVAQKTVLYTYSGNSAITVSSSRDI